jgi:hypothetical protein
MATSLGGCAGLGRSARQGEARNRPAVQGATHDRRGVSWRVPGGTSRGPSGHAALREGTWPRSARGPEAEVGGRPWRGTRGAPERRRRDAARFLRYSFSLGYFEHVFLPIIEQKCTKW